MERLVRGLFRTKNPDGSSNPPDEECYQNWMKLLRSSVKFEGEDANIVDYFHVWPWHDTRLDLGDVTSRISAPDVGVIKTYFEQSDNIEAVNRLAELARVPVVIRSNYASVISAVLERQRVASFVRALREASIIAEHGRTIGKEKLQGIEHAEEHLQRQLRKNADEASVGRFELEDVGGALAIPDEPIRYLLPHFRFAEGRPNVIVAWAGLSKTFLMLELAIAVAAGLPSVWGGVAVGLHGKAVVLDYEMGRKISRRRVRRLAHGLGIAPKAFEGRLFVSYLPRTYLTSASAEGDLARLCEGKAVCLIDSFRASTPNGKDENSSEMADYLNILSRVSEATGCVFVVLHHERKAKEGEKEGDSTQKMRGSSALVAAMGATVSITRREDGVYKIAQGKVSTGRAGTPVRYRLEDIGEPVPMHDDTEGLRIVGVVEGAEHDGAEHDKLRIVYEIIESKSPKSRDELLRLIRESGMGIKTTHLKPILEKLEADKLIVRPKDGGFYAAIEVL